MNYQEKIQSLEDSLSQGESARLLYDLANFVMGVWADPRYIFRVFESRPLDDLCLQLGRALLGEDELRSRGDRKAGADSAFYVASALMHVTGGHTQALRDVIRARPGIRHVVFVTNPMNDPALNDEECAKIFEEFGGKVEVHVAPAIEYHAKADWLLAQLGQEKPERLYLFNHHYDALAVGFAQPELAGKVYFFHHGDHSLCLGVHIPHAVHVDCSEASYEQCRHRFGVTNNTLWPLSAADRGALPDSHAFMKDGELLTASHGSGNKFERLEPNIPYSYADVVVARLSAANGRHFHLGVLSDSMQAEILSKAAEAGVDPARLVSFGHVPSLWDWLLAHKIDLCINSFPTQGFKGMVETMGAGIPMIVYRSRLSRFHSTPEFAYQGAFHWETLEELKAHIRACNPAVLKRHGHRSRFCYTQYHRPEVLQMCVTDPGFEPPMKKLLPFHEDSLARHFE